MIYILIYGQISRDLVVNANRSTVFLVFLVYIHDIKVSMKDRFESGFVFIEIIVDNKLEEQS